MSLMHIQPIDKQTYRFKVIGQMKNPLYSFSDENPCPRFPELDNALADPNGLLAIGGDLSEKTLLDAYAKGIFPWYETGQPILWWSPDPRCILLPGKMKISRSLRKTLRKGHFTVTLDQAFSQVINRCAGPRKQQSGTWITADIFRAFLHMHRQGHAHSVEVWHQDTLVGGLYGLAIGKVFFGESMFSGMTDASKVAMVTLSQVLSDWGYELIDCQVHNPHLESLGASCIGRQQFRTYLDRLCVQKASPVAWQQHANTALQCHE